MSKICDDLRASILQAAMQGKLTKQLPEDGDVQVLLKQIANEKEKLPRKKKDLPISESEKLFEIPSSWCWQKLENISVFIGDKNNQIKESSVKKEGKHKVVSQSKEQFIGYCDDDTKLLKIDSPVLVFGDHTALIKYIDFDFIIGADGVKVIKPLCVNIKYLYYALKYNLIGVNEIGGYSRHYKFIKDKLIPLPPLAEQKRIVAKVDELMARVADLEKSADALARLKSHYPDEMRASLLQAAMQGKLTERLPSDGNADELLQQIQAEKEQLIASGKIKKSKTALAPATEKEIPFPIPSTWKWVRFGEIVDFNMGKTPPRADTSYWKNDIPWVSIADMPDGGILLETKEKISNKAFIEKFKSKICQKETLIMSFKLTVGRCSILGIDAVHNEAIISIFPILDQDFSCRNYLARMLPFLANYGETKDAIKGRTLNSESLNNLLIPLPPLAEQKRIVDRLDEAMKNIDTVATLIASE